MEFTPEYITELPQNCIYVFGSNTEGRHGKGAAKIALDKFDAIYGQARGLQGRSYGIVTKDLRFGNRSVPLYEIRNELRILYDFAVQHSELKFYVVKIGCSLAGYSIDEMGDLFKGIEIFRPDNVIIPIQFYSQAA